MPHATEEYLGDINSTKHNKTWKNCVIHSTEVVERDAASAILNAKCILACKLLYGVQFHISLQTLGRGFDSTLKHTLVLRFSLM